MRLLFCALAGRAFGYGHLNRCLSIAACARKRGLWTTFLVLGEGAEIARNQGFTAEQVNWLGSVPIVSSDDEVADTVAIIDVAHPSIFPRQSELLTLLKGVRQSADKIVAIDGLGKDSFAVAMPHIPVDVMAIPYIGGAAIPHSSIPMLVGPEYALLSPDYSDLPLRRVNQMAERILVTFGGSDPQALTPVVLSALARISRKLTVRIVIGPLFSEDMTAAIERQAAKSHHSVELLFCPPRLVEYMQWADIAIAASGLVKYELAATGTPGILISIDKAHDLANGPFSRERLQRDLGVTADPLIISQAVEELLCRPDERRDMAERGQHLIDGKGAERLISALSPKN